MGNRMGFNKGITGNNKPSATRKPYIHHNSFNESSLDDTSGANNSKDDVVIKEKTKTLESVGADDRDVFNIPTFLRNKKED